MTGPSGHACCRKQTDPLHSEGQGQSWDDSAVTRPSKLGAEVSGGLQRDLLPVDSGLTAHINRSGILQDDRSLLGAACLGKVF